MPWEELPWLALALLGLVILGHLWFHFVEALLARAKRLLFGPPAPQVWHELPDEKEETDGP